MKKSILFFWFLLVSNSIWAQISSVDTPPGPDIVLNWEKNECTYETDTLFHHKLIDKTIIKDTLNVCTKDWSTYYINGDNLKEVISIKWLIKGGDIKKTDDIVAAVLWDDTILTGSIKVSIVFDNLTTLESTFYVRKAIKSDDAILAPNSIKFDYDTAGNQIKRSFIYLARQSNNNTIASKEEPKFVPTDDYGDVLYYPNPVKQELNVKWVDRTGQDMELMELYDLSGKLMHVYPNQSTLDSAIIDFQLYPQGLYNLILVYKGGERKTLRIVKQ